MTKTVIKTKEKPILFNTTMVKSLINGSKVQTRRIVKGIGSVYQNNIIFESLVTGESFLQLYSEYYPNFRSRYERFKEDFTLTVFKLPEKPHERKFIKCKYSVGDILYVKETYAERKIIHHKSVGDEIETKFYFKADMKFWADKEKWKSSLFMPRKYARIFLKVTNIRVEKLQDITEEDAIKEGIEKKEFIQCSIKTHVGWKDYIDSFLIQNTPIESYETLWNSINAKKEGCSWKDNPYVFVLEFEVLKDYV